PGGELNEASRTVLQTTAPGGIVLFRRNVDRIGDLWALGKSLRTELGFRPMIGIDVESRQVNRLMGIVDLPHIGPVKSRGLLAAVELGQTVGQWLKELSVDIDFAPVLDLELSDPPLGFIDNALHLRCWGQTGDEVARWAGAFIDGLQSHGVAACGK